MSTCLLLTAGLLPTSLPSPPLQILSLSSPSDQGHAGLLSKCLPLGIMVGFTWRNDSVVFILVQSLDQRVLAAVQLTKVAGSAGLDGDPQELEELMVFLVREWCSWLLCLRAPRGGYAPPAQEHWWKNKEQGVRGRRKC